MAEPLVSILIPVFNAEPWLAATLDSALAQTWPNIEIVVVDDGSTDRSLDVANGYVEHHPSKIKVIQTPNRGHAAARNTGISESRGQYLQFLDADDLMSTSKIEAQVRLLQEAPGCLATCRTEHFFDEDVSSQTKLDDAQPFIDSDDPVEFLVNLYGGHSGKYAMISVMAWLVPRDVATKAGPWDTNIITDADGEYFARVVVASRGVRVASRERVYYRRFRNRRSVSADRSAQAYEGRLRAVTTKANVILSRRSDRAARRAAAVLYSTLCVGAYPRQRAVADICEERLRELAVDPPLPVIGGPTIQWIARKLGWKVARRLQDIRARLRR